MKLLQRFNIRLLFTFAIIFIAGCSDIATVLNESESQINAPNYNPDDWSTQNDLYNLEYQAENGDTSAMIELYERYRYSDGVEKHLLRAISYLKKASALGDDEATRKLMNIYRSGVRTWLLSKEFEIEKDPVLAKEYTKIYLEQLKVNAEHDSEAGFWLARAYEKGGGGLEVDIKQAQYYYEKSAQLLEEKVKSGDVESRLLYAKLKRNNQHPSIIQNESVVLEMLEQLVVEGQRESHLLLASIYLKIHAVDIYKAQPKIHKLTDKQAEDRAIGLLTNAAKKGDSEAQRKLVYHYRDKLEEDENAAESLIYWADKAMPQNINDETSYSLLFNAKLKALTAIDDGEGLINSMLHYYSRGKFKDFSSVADTSRNIANAFYTDMNVEDLQAVVMRRFINSIPREKQIQLIRSFTEKLVTLTKYLQSESYSSVCLNEGRPENYSVANRTAMLMQALNIDSDYYKRLQASLDAC